MLSYFNNRYMRVQSEEQMRNELLRLIYERFDIQEEQLENMNAETMSIINDDVEEFSDISSEYSNITIDQTLESSSD